MKKEKLQSLTKYLGRLEERASAKVPSKWSKSPKTFKEFISREMKMVKDKLDAAQLEGTVDKK